MIKPKPFPISPNFQEVVRALLRMHKFTLDGKDESEEADLLRESMSGRWESLSQAERERVTGLSKDLYDISDHAVRPAAPMNAQAQGKLNEVYEARERGEWDRALELLRLCKDYIPAALVSYLRGTIWSAAGNTATAIVFFEHASQLDSKDDYYQAVLFDAINATDPMNATA